MALGYTSSCVAVINMDYLVEVTYPFSEGMLFAVANTISMIPTFLLVPLITSISTHYNAVIANTTFLVIAVMYVLISCFVKEDLKRKKANQIQ
ncbi:feline leukemia virus subgroup C-like protein, partial [Leptotrombidium deliense]